MCGLAGFIDLRAAAAAPAPFRARGTGLADADERIVRAMLERLRHRGPDMEGTWRDLHGRCVLGHRRLSILDTSTAGRQPMTDPSGRYTLVFNGEIYNWRELRAGLEDNGERFATGTDTEVLLRLLARDGEAALPRLDGMFAFALWDAHAGRLVLARDRAGEKPLLLWSDGRRLAFASELPALAAVPGFEARLSETGLAAYLMLRYVPAPASLLDGVARLRPGHAMTIDASGAIAERRWFAFEATPATRTDRAAFDATCDQVEDALVRSLERRLVADVPVGFFLSGGIDSALACALASRRLGQPVVAHTVGFDGDPDSEDADAADIAAHLGIEHRRSRLGADALARFGAGAGEAVDEPNGDRSCVPTAMLCDAARRDVVVAISGDGADELFGGYGRYRTELPGAGRPGGGASPQAMLEHYLAHGLPVFDATAVGAALPEGADAVRGWLHGHAPLFQHPGRAPIHALRQLDFATYLPGAVLAKVDRTSMRVGLEVRTPYLSPELLAIAARLPAAFCATPQGLKPVLRCLLARHLPLAHALRPKRGFGMPAATFAGNATWIRERLAEALARLAMLPFFAVRPRLLPMMTSHATRNANAAWATIVLGQWVARFPELQ